MSQLNFKTPSSINELRECLKVADERTWVLCGGTDLTIKILHGGVFEGCLIDISKIKELNYIEAEDNMIKIGATTTFSQLSENKIIREHATCLAKVAEQVGSTQIRNTASLCGNIATASPGGDSPAVLESLKAVAKIMDADGNYTTKPISEVILGIGKTCLDKKSVITEIQIPKYDHNYRSCFVKSGMTAKRTVIIANVGISMLAKYTEESDTIDEISIVLGSCAPKFYHATNAENILLGQKPTSELKEKYAIALQEHVKESINGVKIFECKIDTVKGLAYDVFESLFPERS